MTTPPDEPTESQTERTRLAWRRTVLVGGVVALLLARLAVDRGEPWLAPAAVVGWLVGAVTAQRRIKALAADDRGTVGRPLIVAVLLTLWYAGLGAAVATAH